MGGMCWKKKLKKVLARLWVKSPCDKKKRFS